MNPLTKRQAEALDFISVYSAVKGCPPSLREVAYGLGLKSVSSAAYVVKQLEFKGCLERVPGLHRGLRVLK